jgi:hypothetical protein
MSRSIQEYRNFQMHRHKFAKVSDDHEKLDRIEKQMYERAMIDKLVYIDEMLDQRHPFFEKMYRKISGIKYIKAIKKKTTLMELLKSMLP